MAHPFSDKSLLDHTFMEPLTVEDFDFECAQLRWLAPNEDHTSSFCYSGKVWRQQKVKPILLPLTYDKRQSGRPDSYVIEWTMQDLEDARRYFVEVINNAARHLPHGMIYISLYPFDISGHLLYSYVTVISQNPLGDVYKLDKMPPIYYSRVPDEPIS